MPKTQKFRGSVINGKFAPFNKNAFIDSFKAYEGKKCEVSVGAIKRSNNQNGYLWGVVYELIREECGYLVSDEVHDEMRALFWFKIGVSGEKILKSTTDMSTFEMEDYLSKIRVWASSFLGLPLPLPNEDTF